MKPEKKLLTLIPVLFILRAVEQAVPDAATRNAIVLIALLVFVGYTARTAIRRIFSEVTR